MRRKRKTNDGMAMTTTHAPSVNLETRKTMVAMAVMHAPMPLMVARRRQWGGRVFRQCTTSPACDRVKPMKTPMAKRGISVFVLPSTATRRAPARTASTTMPFAKVCRSPRMVKRCGR